MKPSFPKMDTIFSRCPNAGVMKRGYMENPIGLTWASRINNSIYSENFQVSCWLLESLEGRKSIHRLIISMKPHTSDDCPIIYPYKTTTEPLFIWYITVYLHSYHRNLSHLDPPISQYCPISITFLWNLYKWVFRRSSPSGRPWLTIEAS